MSDTTTTDDRAMLDLEYRLTISHRIVCECAPYFARRREVLIPAVMERATERGVDAVDLFAAFARGVHRRHLAGLSLATEARVA